MDHEDFIEKILDDLDDDYKSISDILKGHDMKIAFDE